MALDLNAIATQNRGLKVDFMGHNATVLYNPSALTAEAIAKSKTGDAAFSEFFCELVKDWDVKRGTKKVPLNQKGLEGVPVPLLKAIFTGILRDGTAADTDEGKVSSDG